MPSDAFVPRAKGAHPNDLGGQAHGNLWERRRHVAQRIATLMDQEKVFRNCTNCEHWRHTEERCGKWNARPPATVIVTGCDDHSDEIPF